METKVRSSTCVIPWRITAAVAVVTMSCFGSRMHGAVPDTANGSDVRTQIYEAVRAGRMSPSEFATALAKLSPAQLAAPIGADVEQPPSPLAVPAADHKAVAALSPKPSPPPLTRDPIDELADYIGVRKTFLSQDGEDDPAKLSWTKNEGTPSFYSLDAAVQLRGQEQDGDTPAKGFSILGGRGMIDGEEIEWNILPTFEAHISSDPKNAQDSLSARLPITLSVANDPNKALALTGTPEERARQIRDNGEDGNRSSPITAWFLTISPVWEFDRLKANETIGGDIFLTANVPSLWIGRPGWLTASPIKHPQVKNAVSFNWRPYLGFEGGDALKAQKGTDLALTEQYIRFAAKVHGELAFRRRRAQHDDDKLDFYRQLVLSVDYYFRQEFEGKQIARNYVEVSPTFFLDSNEHFSMGLTYKRGQTTPKFSEVNSLNAWIGVKY